MIDVDLILAIGGVILSLCILTAMIIMSREIIGRIKYHNKKIGELSK